MSELLHMENSGSNVFMCVQFRAVSTVFGLFIVWHATVLSVFSYSWRGWEEQSRINSFDA